MEKEISKATLKRLPTYLAYLKSLPEGSSVNISATALAAGLHMGEVQVRKDLALVSSGGRPKIGYNRAALIADIEQVLDEVIFLQNGRVERHTTVDAIRGETGKSVDELFREVFKC